jgi:multidrug efflux pump subunit AcrA (membrane-fusion protein)
MSQVLKSSKFLRVAPLLLAGALAAAPGRPASAPAGDAVVQERSFAASPSGYAVVEAVTPLVVRALADGVLEGWRAAPGLAVRRGEALGRLAGPEREQEVVAARTAVGAAKASLTAARQAEAAARETYPVITSAPQLAAAQAAVAQAKGALAAARAHLAFVREAGVIRAPVSGSLSAVEAAEGESVAAGAPLATMEDTDRLWLRGVFYGAEAEALAAGESGSFLPAGARSAIPVRVRSVIAPMRADGGREVGCDPVEPAGWFAGEAGTLRLAGPAKTWPAVPDEALVLEGVHWYVLVAAQAGEERREVVPGPESNGWTAILDGLRAGERVVVRDAYLRFHRDVAKRYAPPD